MSGLAIVFGLLLFVLILFLVLPIVLVTESSMRRHVAGWRDLAARTNLAFEPEHGPSFLPRVTGTYRGRQLRIEPIEMMSGPLLSGQEYATRIMLGVNNRTDGSFELRDKPPIMLTEVPNALTGDEPFDRKFFLKSQPKDFAVGVLASSRLRQLLMQIDYPTLKVSGDILVFQEPRIVRSVDRLEAYLNLLCDLAEAAEQVSTREVES